MKRWQVLTCLCILTVSCGREEQTSDASFITLPHTGETDNINWLITKVHDPSWDIAYGFDSDTCTTDEVGRNMEAWREAIRASLQTWLQPLRSIRIAEGIISDFDFIVYRTVDTDSLQLLVPGTKWLDTTTKYDLGVIFYCRKERSYTLLPYTSEVPPTIHLLKPLVGSIYPPDYFISGTEHLLVDIIHEIGHAFGMADTYVENVRDMDRYSIPRHWWVGCNRRYTASFCHVFHLSDT